MRNNIYTPITSLEEEISKAIGVEIPVYSKFREALRVWAATYVNEAPWLGKEGMHSLNLGSAIASEIARLVCLEFTTGVTTKNIVESAETETESRPQTKSRSQKELVEENSENPINEDYQRFIRFLRPQVEYAAAQGGIVFKPFQNESGHVYITSLPATQVYPITISPDGRVTEAVFTEFHIQDGKYYTLVEYHKYNGDVESTGNELIVYRAFLAPYAGVLGNGIPLAMVDKWAEFPPQLVLKEISTPMFTYFKLPLANTIDLSCPLGVSVYAKAIDLMGDADTQYSRYLWEYEAGEAAINVDASAISYDANKKMRMEIAHLNNRLYRAIDQQDLFEMWAPMLRDGGYYAGLNNILRKIEFECGLSYNTLSDANVEVLTATEIISSRQRSYGTVHEIQTSLEETLKHIVHMICALHKVPFDSVETTFNWDDSIIMDTTEQKNIFLQEITTGIAQPWEYRVKFYGETENEAKKMTQKDDADIHFSEEKEEEPNE
jgi:A118 family predicted phage portal protein